ncbi:hypothetical protein MSAN_02366600 [Mycena sanguinolenta]|uniref:Uncharacterized protein n=1 Tax=Mycena sanguinolenta TaxID=230812 RepID=A0A8H6X5D5_9AGAR|nr:hypothetical protein MSAN_02366600 [Mycena sanguinolenta]
MKHWEHHLTFPIEHQGTVSLWVTVVIQTFGTVYIAILTLTAIHDVISAWAGLGSALISLWKQASVPASVFGTLNIVGYLCCISILHISIPAMISVEVFNTTLAIPASTLGIPEYANGSAINSTRNYMNTFGTNVLPFRGLFDGPQMQGLLNGTLYEVLLNTTSAKGTAQVSATGFNISCGYVSAQISDVDLDPGDGGLWLIVDGLPGWLNGRDSSLFSNALSIYDAYGFGMTDNNNSIYLSTTAVVVDSQGNLGSPLIFAQQPPGIFRNLTNFNLSSSQIQFLKCSKSIVPQSATIDATSNIVLDGTLRPDIYKNHSTWISAAELDFAPKSSTLVGSGLWSETLCSDGGVISVYPTSNAAVNEYLMSYLGLDPFANATSVTLKLHNIENALASVLAMVFWGEYSFLTTTHDKTLAWIGIGSAISTLWEQVKLPGSPLEIVYIFIYLAAICLLHIATPALVSVESFNLSLMTKVKTQGMPAWSNMVDNSTLLLLSKGGVSLPWITNMDPALKLGLSNGSLYDILETVSPGGGSAEMSAVGFNITCGYIPGLTVNKSSLGNDLGYYYNTSSLTEDFHWGMLSNQLFSGK